MHLYVPGMEPFACQQQSDLTGGGANGTRNRSVRSGHLRHLHWCQQRPVLHLYAQCSCCAIRRRGGGARFQRFCPSDLTKVLDICLFLLGGIVRSLPRWQLSVVVRSIQLHQYGIGVFFF